MEALITPALLFAQAVIMFSLGVGLTLADFKRIVDRPYVFAIGICCQVVFVPLCALAIVYLFDFPPVFAAGLMILSFCPGGVTSNIISKLSKADVALSVSLTAIVSVMSFLTVPALVSWAIVHFMGENAIEFSFFDLSIVTFVVTTTPVVLGVILRHYKSKVAMKLESVLEKIAMVLWVIIVALAIANVFEKLVANFGQIGLGILLMPFFLVVFALIMSHLFGLDIRESKTLAVESSIQNSPLAIALAATITGGTGFVGELAIPAAAYSITMYLVAIVFILFFRNWHSKPASQAV